MGANPVIGEFMERCSRRGVFAGIRIPVFGVVNVIADAALVLVKFVHSESPFGSIKIIVPRVAFCQIFLRKISNIVDN